MNNELIKLDIGCGPHKKEGHLGVDLKALPGVDLVVNLDEESLPFADNSIDEIYTSHFMEHVADAGKVIKEFDRVLKNNGILTIIVPHYSNPYAYHFTHKSYWSSFSLNQEYLDYYIRAKLTLKSRKVRINTFRQIDPVLNFLANRFINIYERLFSAIVKAWEIEFVLQKGNAKEDYINIK
jgi:predicted SAM-dependent methyltransferase